MTRVYISKPKGPIGAEHQEFIEPEKIELSDGRTLGDVLKENEELKKELLETKKLLAKILAAVLEVKK